MFGYENESERDRELRKRQNEHMRKVHYRKRKQDQASDCQHNQCSGCHGTGIKLDGTVCHHMISCNCSRCDPFSYLRGLVKEPKNPNPKGVDFPPHFKDDSKLDLVWSADVFI